MKTYKVVEMKEDGTESDLRTGPYDESEIHIVKETCNRANRNSENGVFKGEFNEVGRYYVIREV